MVVKAVMAELVYAQVLEACPARVVGSSPTHGTTLSVVNGTLSVPQRHGTLSVLSVVISRAKRGTQK